MIFKLKKKFSLKKIKKSKIKEKVIYGEPKVKITKTIGFYSITDKILGQGHRSKVYLGYHEISGKKVAVKYFPRDYVDIWKEAIEKEVTILNKFKKSNEVINLENSFLDNIGNYYLVFEVADCNLEQLFQLVGRRLTEHNVGKMVVQILRGIFALHELSVAHGDMKLENIFVFNSNGIENEEDLGNISLKLGDLGFSTYTDDRNLLSLFRGSPLYVAPEITLQQPYNGLKSDIWSLGVVIYVLIYRRFPFDIDREENIQQLFYKIQQDDVNLDDDTRIVSEECKHLISLMLSKEPSDRINCKLILSHPWIVKCSYSTL